MVATLIALTWDCVAEVKAATATLLPNFWTPGKSHKLDDTAPQVRLILQAIG